MLQMLNQTISFPQLLNTSVFKLLEKHEREQYYKC